MRARTLRTACLALALAAGAAHAQPVDVPALTKLIEVQPAGEDRTTWKEKRREAARKLGQSKDKRAVPVLIKLAETETFDIIGDIAIEGLGTLGDASAVPALTKISNDQARDKATRDIAKKALAKLPTAGTTTPPNGGGTPAPTGGGTPPDGGGTPPPDGGGTPPPDPGIGGSTVGGTPDGGATGGTAIFGGGTSPADEGALPPLPELPEDTLAAWDRLTFAAGTAALSYDTIRKRPAFDADVSGRYARRVEREAMAWGFDAGAHVVGGFVNPEGAPMNRGLQLTVDGGGEARFYKGQIYGVGRAAAGVQLNYISAVNDSGMPDQEIKDTRTYADFQIALGVGYGRVLDVGGAIRVRQLARRLDANRALGKQIDAATARRLQLTWWALRGEQSAYRATVATVAILREAGILLGEPDAGLTYEILTVLRDTQLAQRPSGFDVQLAFGEGYLKRPAIDADPDPVVNERGRVEQLLLSAGYGQQLADDKAEISGTAFGRMRLFADEEGENAQPSPWAFGATARLRRFAYGDHGDALGALDVAATVLLSSDGCLGMDCEATKGLRIGGEVGFTLYMNQASGIRLAGNVAQDSGELFIGGTLTATYGLLDATFAGL